jgi:hypothetical protein
MNPGGRLPYQLRPNKAVERLVFLELLSRLNPHLGIARDYDYAGFGGPQMEDFRLLHEIFPDMKMLSIERQREVLKRQRFNRPHTNVRCSFQTSAEFVMQASDRRRLIVWLDYTEADERPTQIAEFQSLLQAVRSHCIIKLTLNAAPVTLGGAPGERGLQARRVKSFLSDFDRCFPNGLEEEAVADENFPSTLLAVVDYACRVALSGRPDWRFQPLTSTAYADSRQQMLTITGLLATKSDVANVLTSAQLANWEFSRLQWTDPVRIQVPELTLKERIFLNQLLPKLSSSVPVLQKKLRFLLAETEAESEEKLRNYVLFERHYPFWGEVAI